MSRNMQVKRTKRWLSDALIHLMRVKPFNAISVQDIVNEAELSRSAFYSHYSSKVDILYEKIQEHQNEYVAYCLSFEDKSQFNNWKRTIEIYLSHAEFYTLLYKNGLGSLVFQAELDDYAGVVELVSQTLKERSPEDTTLYYGVFIYYHRQAQIDLILKWIFDGATTPIDELAVLVSSLGCIDVYNAFQKQFKRNMDRLSLKSATFCSDMKKKG